MMDLHQEMFRKCVKVSLESICHLGKVGQENLGKKEIKLQLHLKMNLSLNPSCIGRLQCDATEWTTDLFICHSIN